MKKKRDIVEEELVMQGLKKKGEGRGRISRLEVESVYMRGGRTVKKNKSKALL